MQPIEFESMAQALLEKTYRIDGNLIQFGSGQDGAREATWSQPSSHSQYSRPTNQRKDVVKEWVFQVKYHDLDQRGWATARDAVLSDLEKELDKVVNKYSVPCHAYVMITNVPFTGARNVGTRDQVTDLAKQWHKHIPEIYVWDAADLSRMLDANEDVRTAYINTILPGDVLKAIYSQATYSLNRKQSAFRAYLRFVTDREGSARAEEAGDDPDLPLSEVFIDLTLKIQDSEKRLPTNSSDRRRKQKFHDRRNRFSDTSLLPECWTSVRSSFALFFADDSNILLLGGPGLGKSTLTQFISLYQAARIIIPDLSRQLADRLKLPEGKAPEDLDAYCRLRFPFRIELRRYARWMSDQQSNQNELARYIVDVLINQNTSSTLVMDDVFELASKNPILLVLDGLDEVPNPEVRWQIVENLRIFLRRIDSEDGDIQIILSSRPKGYSGEFEEFEPITWELNELERTDFDEYCDCWLKNRIPDIEERNEAKERINRGMLSNSVQRLARSLLQATVILTIVRRKIEIPHQRNTLYEKYVEVIFDREKEKWAIVRKYETKLLRLHERVGYELHCKMEQSRIEALDRSTFREYVLRVLEDYSATELGNKRIREVADEIIEAATDRLCLLIGKGKDQTDVDFVVQQYREYFAAVYLSNHPDADPDRVFDMLVQRGAYWAYVLQFYVAQANASQQMRWVTCISEQNDGERSIEALVRRTRTYRAILNVLPEFTLQRRIDFERAIKIILSAETRWTWLGQETVVGILKLIPSIDIFQTTKKIFGNLFSQDDTTLTVELWLLLELSSCQSQEFEELCSLIQNLLNQENTQSIALTLACQYDLKVDLSNCNISKVVIELEKYYYKQIRKSPHERGGQLQDLISFQSKEKQLELFFSTAISWWLDPVILGPKNLLVNFFPREEEVSILGDSVRLRVCHYLCCQPFELRDFKAINKIINEVEGIQAEYLRSILKAIQNPEDYDLDNRARTLEAQLPNKAVHYAWKASNILGPSSANFSSIESWKEFKQEIYRLSSSDTKWISKSIDIEKSSNLWACLFFHPDHWSLLVEESLITENEHNNFLGTPLGRILSIPSLPLDLFNGISLVSDNSDEVPLHEIVRVALNILSKEGVERISTARGLEALLYRQKFQRTVSTRDLDALLHQANSLPSLPSSWISAILTLCMDVSDIDIELLLDFWEKSKSSQPRFRVVHEERFPSGWNRLLERLLSSNHASALDFGVAILACAKPRKQIQDALSVRLLAESNSYINNGNESFELYCRALLNLDPSLEQFSLWSKPEVIDLMRESPWMLDRLSRRFSSAVDPRFKLDHQQLREQFLIFIDNRHNYPESISLGALEAVLKTDEVNLPALESKTWQQDFDQ